MERLYLTLSSIFHQCAKKRINRLNYLMSIVCACFISRYVCDRVAAGASEKEKRKEKEAYHPEAIKHGKRPCLAFFIIIRRLCIDAYTSFFSSKNNCSQAINESLNVSPLMPVMCPGAGTLIARYDEHALVSRFKFGVLHQRAGQVTEEQLFGNRQITPAFQEFLDLLGQKIDLKDHKG